MKDIYTAVKSRIIEFLQYLGFTIKEDQLDIIFFISLTIITTLILPAFKKFRKWNLIRKASIRTNPYYLATEIKNSIQFYVQTKFQNIPPSNEQEPSFSHASVARQKLIPFFLRVFRKPESHSKYYIILADSGMGKTTFMLNLYLRYRRKIFSIFDIYIYPLSQAGIESDIEKIPDEMKCKSIILLDAFDEDKKAADNYIIRMGELMKLTQKFRFVIISCRTQFFPFEEAEPSEIEIIKHGTDGDYHRFKKIYLSPFNEKDIRKFLWKRYSPWQFHKIRRAFKLVNECPYLMVRPMLLTYIDDLLGSDKSFNSVYNIYSKLIKSWVDREVKRQKPSERNRFKMGLNDFSEKFAIQLYRNFQYSTSLSVTGPEVVKFAKESKIDLSDLELKSKSLLNRDANGNFKFAHKSILEFFLAKKAYNDHFFLGYFDFKGFTFSNRIYRDICKTRQDETPKPIQTSNFSGKKQLKIKATSSDADILQNIAGYSDITHLDLTGLNLNDDFLRFIKMIDELEVLNLSSNMLTTVSSLSKLNKLREFDLSNNSIVEFNLSKEFPELERLILRENKIEKYTIRNRKLKELDLSNNPLVTLNCDEVDSLESINLSRTLIQSFPKFSKDIEVITDNEFDLFLSKAKKSITNPEDFSKDSDSLVLGTFNRCIVENDFIKYYFQRSEGVMKNKDYADRFEFVDGLNHTKLKRVIPILSMIRTKDRKPIVDEKNYLAKLRRGIEVRIDSHAFESVSFGILKESLLMSLKVANKQ